MSEEPKARPSINLDELERQLREASRNQAFRKTVADQNSNSDVDETGYLAEGSSVRLKDDLRTENRWSDDLLGDTIVVAKGSNSSFEQIETEPELRGPPPFLMGSRDDRFPEVGSGSDTVTGTRSWRSIFLIAFFSMLVVASAYAYLQVGKETGSTSDTGIVPVIKADPSPARVKPEASADSGKSAVGQELFSSKNNVEEDPAVVVSSKEQPVDLSAKKQTEEVQSNGLQTNAGTEPINQGQGADQLASNVPQVNNQPKSVRTVRVQADGTIIDPAGILKAPPVNASSVPSTGLKNSTDVPATVPNLAAAPSSVAIDPEVSEIQATNSMGAVPLPPVRPSNLDMESVTGDPIEAVSGLLANTPENTALSTPTETENPVQPTLTAGLFSVQFGAPATESEARALTDRVKARLTEALAGTEIGIFKGENSGKTVFRVRVVNVTKADGQSLCDNYIAQGGQCFVTRN